MDIMQINGAVLEQEFVWFQQVLEKRLHDYFDPDDKRAEEVLPPIYDVQSEEGQAPYAKFIAKYNFNARERLILALTLAPELKPHALDIFFTKNKGFDRGFSEFGGIVGKLHSGFLPTVETGFFLLAGDDLARRLDCATLFGPEHVFQKKAILELDASGGAEEPFGGTPLRLSQEALALIFWGRAHEPKFSERFPAKKLETLLEWDELVLAPETHDQLSELRAWLDHGKQLLDTWKLEKHVKPGYRCLFYGPPGTGKTLTASLLGRISGRQVFRIDLSQLVSKYIGETEKNLERIFSQAERGDNILFFDEADALFGKRTQISTSNDRYANQGTAYLLQRIEDCPNVVILATNQKANIDEAFTRRFQSIVHFPMPQKRERLKLWQRGFSPVSTLDDKIDLNEIAESYEFSGGSIMNVVRYCSLMAIQKETLVISGLDLKTGLLREYRKEGRSP